MDYAAYVRIVRARAAMPGGREEIYIGALVAANAVAALTGSGISGVSPTYYPLFNGEIVDPGVIQDIMQVPGTEVVLPTLPSSSYGFVKAGEYMPGNYRKPFSYKYIAPYGSDYMKFMGALIALYNERLFPTGLLTAAEQMKINRVLNAGYIVMPAPSNARGDEWNGVVKEFEKAQILYNDNMVKEGYAELEKSRANMRFWNAVVAVTETVAMPVTMATEAAKAAFNYRKPIMIVGLGILGYIAYNKFTKAKKTAKRILS